MSSREFAEWVAFYNLEAEMKKEADIRADMEGRLQHG